MTRIKEIIGMDNKTYYANVHVLLDDGTEAVVFIGGKVEVYFDHKYNKVKAFVRKLNT